MRSALRYPIAPPMTTPPTDCFKRPVRDAVSEKPAEPIATDMTAKVRTEPVASLNADSLISACATLSLTLTWWKIGIIVAGSVGAIAAPSNRAVIKGSPIK